MTALGLLGCNDLLNQVVFTVRFTYMVPVGAVIAESALKLLQVKQKVTNASNPPSTRPCLSCRCHPRGF